MAIPALFLTSYLLKRRDLSRLNRAIAVVLVWLFILGPGALPLLADGAGDYLAMLDRWGYNNTVITYGYDNNGSLTSKTTAATSAPNTPTEIVEYGYNLQGRLDSVETDYDADGTPDSVVYYQYDTSGNRVGKQLDNNADGTIDSTESYLVDDSNPTGYSQVLEERTDGSLSKTYTIGDDILAQTLSSGTISQLLYDGHGSTRQLLTGSAVSAVYDYDSYGIGTQTDEYAGSSNLQYTGEMKDSETSDYYLRARYYSPANGRFNRIDPYAGNTQDPQSLHKYLYCHANPVNGVDPSGMEFSLSNMMANVAVRMTIFGLKHPALVSTIGFVVNLLLPQEFHEAMIGSGIPPFRIAGQSGMMSKGYLRSLNMSKSPMFRRIVSWADKSFGGRLWNKVGIAFEDYFVKLMPDATRGVSVGKATRHTVDYLWRGYVIEIKSGLSIDKGQLNAISQYANSKGLTLIYFFLREPPQNVQKQILNAGGSVISIF